jgi:nucleoside-diphosphate-sugar epimerase
MATRIIVGCGYVGCRIANRWIENGDTVFAFTRSNGRSSELAAAGIRPLIWNWHTSSQSFPAIFQGELAKIDPLNTTLLVSASHAQIPEIPAVDTHVRGLTNLCHLLANQLPHRLVYLSTTGVFGNGGDGLWLDENSEASPARPGSIAAYAAECWLGAHAPLEQKVVLRPSGIYGPGRLPKWQTLRDGLPISVDPDSYLNLVHVDDLVRIIEYASDHSMKHPVYCVSDGEPVLRRDYYSFLANLGGWPPPLFDFPSGSNSQPVRNSRSEGNKRIRNDLILAETQHVFQYPSFREGLSALFGADQGIDRCSAQRTP